MWNAYVMEHNHQHIALVLFYFGNGTRPSSQCIKQRKIRFSKTRIAYYSNSVATHDQVLLLGGDVAKNPGPGQEKAANTKNIASSSKTTPAKCDFCEKTITRNQKSTLCVNCIGCFHWKCVNWKPMVSDWLCDKCIMAALPL